MNKLLKLHQIKNHIDTTALAIFDIDGHGQNTERLDDAKKLVWDLIQQIESEEFPEE